MTAGTGACFSAAAACLTVLILRLLFKGFLEREDMPPAGGILFLLGLTVGTLFFADASTGGALLALLITAGAVATGFADDVVRSRSQKGNGLPPWLLLLLVLLLCVSASLYLGLSENPGREQRLPAGGATASLQGWYMLLCLPLLLLRFYGQEKLYAPLGLGAVSAAMELVFFAVVYLCMAGTGVLKSAVLPKYAQSMTVFCASAAGSLLALMVFPAPDAFLHPGRGLSFGLAGALSMALLSSGLLLLAPFAALWPFAGAVYALYAFIRRKKDKNTERPLLLSERFAVSGASEKKLFDAVRWLSLLSLLAGLVLYML